MVLRHSAHSVAKNNMGKLGIVLDPGSYDCKHQALVSVCGYEYCTNCDYKFFGHCSKCVERKQKLDTFIKQKLEEFKDKLHG